MADLEQPYDDELPDLDRLYLIRHRIVAERDRLEARVSQVDILITAMESFSSGTPLVSTQTAINMYFEANEEGNARTITEFALKNNWRATMKDRQGAIATCLSRMTQKGEIERIAGSRPATYRRPGGTA
jgi:hypothetical protein